MDRARNRRAPRMPHIALCNSNVFQILHDQAHFAGGPWLVHDIELLPRQGPADAGQEFLGILLRPKVYIDGVQSVQVFSLVPGVKGRQVPFLRVDRTRAIRLPVWIMDTQCE